MCGWSRSTGPASATARPTPTGRPHRSAGRGATGRPPRPRPVRRARLVGRRGAHAGDRRGRAARVSTVGIAAGLVPGPAYEEPAVLAAAHFGQRLLAEMATEMGVEATAAELRPLPRARSPDPRAGPRSSSAPATTRCAWPSSNPVPGALDAMAAGMIDAVRGGLGGLRRDLELQMLPPDIELRFTPRARAPLVRRARPDGSACLRALVRGPPAGRHPRRAGRRRALLPAAPLGRPPDRPLELIRGL